jgi:hypothetical protein
MLKMILAINLGCYDKISLVEWFVSNRNLFPIVLEARKSKMKEQADSVCGEDLLPRDGHFFLCVFKW